MWFQNKKSSSKRDLQIFQSLATQEEEVSNIKDRMKKVSFRKIVCNQKIWDASEEYMSIPLSPQEIEFVSISLTTSLIDVDIPSSMRVAFIAGYRAGESSKAKNTKKAKQ